MTSSLAKNIRKYRKERNLTIEELANNLNANYSQFSRMERGLVNPSVSIIFDVANTLEIGAGQPLED